MSNVTTLLDAKSVPEAKAALVCPSRNRTYSYKELREEMNRVGHGLSGLGIKKGDRVCIFLDSSPEYLISYFAIWRIGAVAVPTNIVYQEEELLHAVSDAGACAIITDSRGVRIVAEVQKKAPALSQVICVADPGTETGPGVVAWSSFGSAPESMRAANCA
ncbi:MAG: class I adenylate-forming enzyme family protein, partial [Methanoregula sp.]